MGRACGTNGGEEKRIHANSGKAGRKKSNRKTKR
jgi:hypothetical protein